MTGDLCLTQNTRFRNSCRANLDYVNWTVPGLVISWFRRPWLGFIIYYVKCDW